MEKARVIDPLGHAGLTPSGKIKMTPVGSCTAIARHIERSTQPDNAHLELRHLNRDDFIKYPDGVDALGEAIQHRLVTMPD